MDEARAWACLDSINFFDRCPPVSSALFANNGKSRKVVAGGKPSADCPA
jgi:hypothetical protein